MNYEELVKSIRAAAYIRFISDNYIVVEEIEYNYYVQYGFWSSTEELAWKLAYKELEETIFIELSK